MSEYQPSGNMKTTPQILADRSVTGVKPLVPEPLSRPVIGSNQPQAAHRWHNRRVDRDGGNSTARQPLRPEGAGESQREAILRMLAALRAVTDYPGDRVIAGHGLMVSVLTWGVGPQRETLPLFLPEAPNVEPLGRARRGID
ncbi:hypothetical protein AB0F43_29785 [Kribbella sp. NPDC023972]|uniref:hypothetical protein n=1 Tax=Kribbella sp. NPDC023972 TaxID=3154795 RepID=UPI0033EC9E92